MKRNCNLELRLVTPSIYSYSPGYINDARHHSMMDSPKKPLPPPPQQQLTIFYKGRVASCDVTELQARAIISLASTRQMEDTKPAYSPGSDPTSPVNLYSPTSGLSMKRSLQRFLQKRKTRAQAISPYPPVNYKQGFKLTIN